MRHPEGGPQDNIEGALFVVRRSVQPSAMIVVLNRNNPTNLAVDVGSATDIELQPPYIFIRGADTRTFGFWFGDAESSRRMHGVLVKIRSAGGAAGAAPSVQAASGSASATAQGKQQKKRNRARGKGRGGGAKGAAAATAAATPAATPAANPAAIRTPRVPVGTVGKSTSGADLLKLLGSGSRGGVLGGGPASLAKTTPRASPATPVAPTTQIRSAASAGLLTPQFLMRLSGGDLGAAAAAPSTLSPIVPARETQSPPQREPQPPPLSPAVRATLSAVERLSADELAQLLRALAADREFLATLHGAAASASARS